MKNNKICLISDTHCGVRNSSDIFIDYQKRFYTEVLFPYLNDNNIKHIIHMGDYYDNRKFINFKALEANNDSFLNKLRLYNIKMDIIPGNHDLYYKFNNSLSSLNNLMRGYEDCVNIYNYPVELNNLGKLDIALIPWISNDNYIDTVSFLNKTNANICIGHFKFSGFEMNPGYIIKDGLDSKIFKKFDAVYSGHYHTKSSKGNIHYLGSQMEFTWIDCNDSKFFHILNTDTGKIEAIQNPLTMFVKILYDDTKFDYSKFNYNFVNNKFIKIIIINKNDLELFDKFIDNILKSNIYDLKILETFNEIILDDNDDINISTVDDTFNLLSKYIDKQLNTKLDKTKLKHKIKELYVEAQDI